MKTLILGGARSGKSRLAENLAAQSGRKVIYLATAAAGDDEMARRIAHHRDRRPAAMTTDEATRDLAGAIRRHAAADTLVLVDCLTLWLTNLLMPAVGTGLSGDALESQIMKLTQSMIAAPGPLVLVGNEIGLGVIPLGREVRAFVDALGRLNQTVAAACSRATLMAAGLPLTLKDVA